MNLSQNDARLSLFPQVGTDIRVHSQNGLKTYAYGRISSDGESIVIDVIKKSREKREFPTISKTVALDLEEVVKISFKNLSGERISLLGDSNYWLGGFPKHGKSSVLVLCREKDRTVDISCGWVNYTSNKVIISEVVHITEHRSELTDIHERFLSEVVLVLVSDDEESKICVRTTETK